VIDISGRAARAAFAAATFLETSSAERLISGAPP
jgi:hypothetical protein